MGQSKIVTIGPVFILSDIFHTVAVFIAKAPYFHFWGDDNASPQQ